MITVSNKEPLTPRGDYSPVVRDRINRLKQDADRLFSLGAVRKRCQQALVQFYSNLEPEPYVDLRTQLSNNREYRFAQSLTLTYRCTNDRLVQWAKGCMSEYLLQEAIEERERWIENFARIKIASRWYQMKDDDEAWRVFSQNIPYGDADREQEIEDFFETLDILCILTDVINGHAAEYGLAVDYNTQPLTGILASEKAVKYWEQLIEQQFVDQRYMLLDSTTRQQAMYIAELFAEKLELKDKWKTFEDFWGINNLAQEKHKCIEKGKLPVRYNVIDEIFSIDVTD